MHPLRSEGDIGKNGPFKELLFGKLKEHPNPLPQSAQVGIFGPYLYPINDYAATGRTEQTIEVLNQRCLTGASDPDDSRAASSLDLKVDTAQRHFPQRPGLVAIRELTSDNDGFVQCLCTIH